jgi:hypothetical protein
LFGIEIIAVTVISHGFVRASPKTLSNKELSEPTHNNYPFKTAFAIIFTLKPITDASSFVCATLSNLSSFGESRLNYAA